MKITKKQIEIARKKFSEGVKVYDIARELGISASSIYYWVDKNQREKRKDIARKAYYKLTKEQRKEIYEKKKEYTKAYLKRRYHEDEEFRKKHIQNVIKSKQKRKT